MKSIYFFLFISLLLNNDAFSQDNFYLKNVKSQEKEGYYQEQISKANLESFRLRSNEVILEFEEGFQCVLLPAESLKSKKIDSKNYPVKFSKYYVLPQFSIHPQGTLQAVYPNNSKK